MQTHTDNLQWHPAFSAALRIELENELDMLDIREEYLLGKKPMQMDILIIKKEKDVPIRKNIGRIFRTYNIIEYKSPEDSLSINDFYKVYGYACFYQADTRKVMEISPEALTITLVCNHYPRKMLHHLQKVRNLSIQRQEAGIYYLTGDPIPIQLLITKELSKKENYWLQSLRNDYKSGTEIQELMKHYEANRHSSYHEAVMDLIVRANWEQIEEERRMCDALRELFAEELKESEELGMKKGMEAGIETGIKTGIKTGERQGIKLAKTIFKLSAGGVSLSDIARQCNISEKYVREILE